MFWVPIYYSVTYPNCFVHKQNVNNFRSRITYDVRCENLKIAYLNSRYFLHEHIFESQIV